jgi:hypothetical protein
MSTKATELATINAGTLACAFGGEEAAAPIEEMVWPEVLMPKDSKKFQMPDGEMKEKLTGFFVFARRTRAFFSRAYGDGDPGAPDCANTDAIGNAKPDFGDEYQADLCAKCRRREWRVVEDDKAGTKKNVQDCRSSMIVFFLEDEQSIPYLLRVRSTSCSKKSDINRFMSNCLAVRGFALPKDPARPEKGGIFQTVHAKLGLEPVTLNGFKTNRLTVEKVGVIQDQDRANLLIDLYSRIKNEFKVTFTQEENGGDDPIPGGDDDVPI